MAESDRSAMDVDVLVEPLRRRVPSSFFHASTTLAKASLISTKSMSSIERPAFSRTFLVAGIGPVSIVIGSVPARANCDEPGPWLESELLGLLRSGDEHGRQRRR